MVKSKLVQERIDENGENFTNVLGEMESDGAYTYLVVNGEPVLKIGINDEIEIRDGVSMLDSENTPIIG